MKTTPKRRYNITVFGSVSNLSLASLSIVCQSDEDARMHVSNALYLIGEAFRTHEQDVLRLAAGGSFRVGLTVDEYRSY